MGNKSLNKKAIVLLSGGLDSATTLYAARAAGYKVLALIFDYDQRHKREVAAAKAVARRAGCAFTVLKIKLPWKGSALLDRKIKVPSPMSQVPRDIPVTYVPARNTVFLSFALSCAEAVGASRIFIGANAIDYSGYPDCRTAYFKAFQRLASLGTRCGVQGQAIRIETPLVRLTKSQIIRRGMRLKVPYGLTWSCYQGKRRPCGACDSCRLRAKGFKEAGLKDPLLAMFEVRR
jgi:7-cyano-7-deazaguanine synthase